MNSKINKSDFTFKFVGYGHFNVTYQSPVTGKTWSRIINDMSLIDATKNEEFPKRKDLEALKRALKA